MQDLVDILASGLDGKQQAFPINILEFAGYDHFTAELLIREPLVTLRTLRCCLLLPLYCVSVILLYTIHLFC